MGIIKRQALQSTIINFVGIGFGSISRLLMPFVMSRSEIGILSFIDSINGIFVTVFSLGYNLIMKKVFPKYRDEENGHHGFLVFGILLSLVGIAIGLTIFLLFQEQIIANNSDNGDLLRPFVFLIPILIFFRVIYLNLDGYVRMLFKTVIGTFLEGFLTKISLFVMVICLYYAAIEYEMFVYLYCAILSVPGFIITFYAFRLTKKITLPSREIFQPQNKIGSYILFGLLAGSSGSIIQYVDTLMIYKMIPEDATSYMGVYYTMLFAALLISIPQRNVSRISSVIVAESWKENDLENILDVYQKSATNLLIIGTYMFIIGWACIDPVFEFLPKYEIGKYVFFFLGLAKVTELGTGVSNEIIEASSKYRFITYYNVLLAILVVIFNYIFIPMYGITGAAFATFLAIFMVNIFRVTLLKSVFDLWPFTKQYLIMVILAVGFVLLVSNVDYQMNPLVKILINAVVLSVAFWGLVVGLKLSPDINEGLYKLKRRFLG